ncbi:MAG: twin-arginine translocase subunit TatC, partial [Synergistaceae bacterium]|nr:twin-arginine translocase subunit TatC [Synergistaceae bacterium]
MPENSGRSPLLHHLLELRRVIIICFASTGAAFCVIFCFLIDYLMLWITRPIQNRGIQIIYTTMSEALLTKFKVSIVAAVIASSP